jgi:hypothetical protein
VWISSEYSHKIQCDHELKIVLSIENNEEPYYLCIQLIPAEKLVRNYKTDQKNAGIF